MQPKRTMTRRLIGLGVLAAAIFVAYAMINPKKGYEPEQPIFFRHKRMAGKPNWVKQADGTEVNLGGFNIPCRYCHTMVYEGRHATLPSTDICMNCHATVGQNREWVLVLKRYWESGQPIPWVKVHDLPDFVYFDHSVHMNALFTEGEKKGQHKVDCTDCHGDVAESDVVSIQNKFNMGWCLECHRKPEIGAPTDCVTCHR